MASHKLNFIFYSLGIAVSGILSFIFIPVVVQMCGKEVYALYSLLFNTLSVVCMFCYAWVGQSFIRFFSSEDKKFEIASANLLNKSLLTGFIFFIPLCFLFTKATFSEIFIFTPTFFLFGFYCYSLLVSQAKQKAFLVMICEVIRSALNIIISFLGFSFLKNINPIYILAVALFISYLIPSLIIYKSNRVYKISLEKEEYKNFQKQILQFGIPIAIFLSGSLALSINDRFIIANKISNTAAGTYSAIYDTINKGVIAAFSPILMTYYPVVTQLYNNNEKKLAFKKIRKLILVEILLISLGLIVLVFICSQLLEIIFKQKADSSLNWITYLVFIGVCLWQIAMLVHKPLELQQKTKLMAIAVVIALMTNFLLNYLFITPGSSLVIPAITTIIGSLVYIGIVEYFIFKKRQA